MTIAGTDYKRLAQFCANLRVLTKPTTLTGTTEHQVLLTPNTVKLSKFLPDLSDLLRKVRGVGDGFNPWSVAALRDNELRNVGVLAALWNPQVCGDHAVQFLDAFLRRLSAPVGQDTLPSRGDLDCGYHVRTEHCPVPGTRSERMDITIEGPKFLLIIEVKIKAGEGNDSQFSRYRRTANEWSQLRGGKPVWFLVLSPFKPGAEFIHFHATWPDVVAAAQVLLPRQQTGQTFRTQLLASFVDHIRQF